MSEFVIVGAGLAGHTAALEIRKLSATARITLIGDEPELPYDRPPLTKEFLLGRVAAADVALCDANGYRSRDIAYRPATKVVRIDRNSRRVLTADGGDIRYDRLLLATGSRPRRLGAGLDSSAVRYFRTLSDATALRDDLLPGRRIVVIGGGFVGLEVAAAASMSGCRVVVVESQKSLLTRGLPALVGETLRRLHEERGVEFHLGCEVFAVAGEGPVVVETSRGSHAADAVIAGIGVLPNVELAADAGLEVDDGIVVDAGCATSDPAIFAAGEVTSHPLRSGVRRRVESWKVATDQPLVAARAMLDMPAAYDAIPWFWSDQYDFNLQVIGTPQGAAGYLLKGDLGGPGWTLVALGAAGAPVGGVAMNSGRDVSMLRAAMSRGLALPPLIAGGARPIELGPDGAVGAPAPSEAL